MTQPLVELLLKLTFHLSQFSPVRRLLGIRRRPSIETAFISLYSSCNSIFCWAINTRTMFTATVRQSRPSPCGRNF